MSVSPRKITRTQVAFQIVGPTIDLAAARHSAEQLAEYLSPKLLDQFAQPTSLPQIQLLNPPAAPTIQLWPEALFRLQPRLSVAELPPSWLHAYLNWAARLKRSRQMSSARVRMEKAFRQGLKSDTKMTDDPIVAGLLLLEFSPAPEMELRGTLMKLALSQPLGGYLCAEALHTSLERKAILEAVAVDSLTLIGTSRLCEFSDACLRVARSRNDLASGVVIARLGTDDEFGGWLRQTGLAAFHDGAAACAMLALNPDAPENLRASWSATLQNSNNHEHAFTTVRWARNTWATSAWESLRDRLKSSAVAHGQCQWFNWFAQIEPECAAAGLEMAADPLWSFELVHALNLDDGALRFRLADQLGQLNYHLPSTLVLEALNFRNEKALEGGR